MVIKIIKSLNYSSILIDSVCKTVKKKIKGERGRFIVVKLALFGGTWRSSLLGNILARKGVMRAGQCGRLLRNLHNFQRLKYLVLLHPLSNIEITKYFD